MDPEPRRHDIATAEGPKVMSGQHNPDFAKVEGERWKTSAGTTASWLADTQAAARRNEGWVARVARAQAEREKQQQRQRQPRQPRPGSAPASMSASKSAAALLAAGSAGNESSRYGAGALAAMAAP